MPAIVVQADSSCQLSATAGGATIATTATDLAIGSSTDSRGNIEWLKWTGAAVLFVEGLIVSPNILQLFTQSVVTISSAEIEGVHWQDCELQALQCSSPNLPYHMTWVVHGMTCVSNRHRQVTDVELLMCQGLLIPVFFKLGWSFLGGWFLSALNCFAGGVFLTFGGCFCHLPQDVPSEAVMLQVFMRECPTSTLSSLRCCVSVCSKAVAFRDTQTAA